MFTAIFIGLLAVGLAVFIVVTATRRHQREAGVSTSWGDVREAFSSDSMKDVRRESTMLADSNLRESDLLVGDLFTDAGEDGAGYISPRDLLASREGRH